MQEMQGQSSEGGERQVIGVSGEAGGGERRRRRKPVLKELSGYDMEEGGSHTPFTLAFMCTNPPNAQCTFVSEVHYTSHSSPYARV